MMVFPLNIDKIGVSFEKFDYLCENNAFKSILKHEEGQEFYCKTKEWMEILTVEDPIVANEVSAQKHLNAFKTIATNSINLRFGIYCSPKNSAILLDLLKEFSVFLKGVKDDVGATYVLEKLFKDFAFFRPHSVLQYYSEEALQALQFYDLDKTEVYLKKLINGVHEYGKQIHKDQLEEFNERIVYLKKQIPQNGTSAKNSASEIKYTNKFVTSHNLDTGDFILDETPRVCLLQKKGYHCDTCHEVANLLPCFECYGVFYCCSECESADLPFHKYECPGLRSKILYLLQSQVDVRNLILTMMELKTIFLSTINEQMVKNAHELWQSLIWMHANNTNTHYFNFFYQKNDTKRIIAEDLKKLCTKTVQILIYLKEFTTFFQDFFGNVTTISSSEIEIFICMLIFRHALIQRTKLLHFKYDVTNKNPSQVIHLNKLHEIKPDHPFVQKSMKFVRKFFDECYQKQEINLFDSKTPHLCTKSLKNLMKNLEKTYVEEKDKKSLLKQKPCEQSFLEETTMPNMYQNLLSKLVETNNKAKLDLKKIFKEFAHEVKTNDMYQTRPSTNDGTFYQTFTCLFSNLTNFEHSCSPNTIQIPRRGGRIQLYATKPLEKGIPITISYGPHYFVHSREERKTKFTEMCIDCKCEACLAEIDFCEAIYNEQCKNCLVPIYEKHKKCLKCNKKAFTTIPKHLFIRLFNKYLEDFRAIEISRFYNAIHLTYYIYDKFLPKESPISLRQKMVTTHYIIKSDEPLIALDMLRRLTTLILNVYPPMSLELCRQLHPLFLMNYEMLKKGFEEQTIKYLQLQPDQVNEALQEGCKISEMIRIIRAAWGFQDEAQKDFEKTNFNFSKLMDQIYESEFTLEDTSE